MSVNRFFCFQVPGHDKSGDRSSGYIPAFSLGFCCSPKTSDLSPVTWSDWVSLQALEASIAHIHINSYQIQHALFPTVHKSNIIIYLYRWRLYDTKVKKRMMKYEKWEWQTTGARKSTFLSEFYTSFVCLFDFCTHY